LDWLKTLVDLYHRARASLGPRPPKSLNSIVVPFLSLWVFEVFQEVGKMA